ncbi:hypothetical protein [Bradyrhizobium oligotrophicum]|uniref:hypothetical protein n=1 Tax=Bradyrhizobium oligotrophicum TaxID=44255 RepID=UPI001360B51B|nr:hypothetical protein [Bradyrhizobium oligotrophicum]
MTVRIGSFVGADQTTLQPDTPTAAHLHVRDDRDTSLMARWDDREIALIPKKRNRKIAAGRTDENDLVERACEFSSSAQGLSVG